MKAIIDTHSHTIASGHQTTDTIADLAKAAFKKGLEILAITDHSPATSGSASANYFRNLKYSERRRCGVQILYGCEADILDTDGRLGLDSDLLKTLDLVIVSQHPRVFTPKTPKENTKAFIRAIKTGIVDIAGHPDDEKIPLQTEDLVKACADYHTAIELNNASLLPDGYRGNARQRDTELLELCEKFGVLVAMGSDSHGARQVGEFSLAEQLLREVSFPEKLVVNYSKELLADLLKRHH